MCKVNEIIEELVRMAHVTNPNDMSGNYSDCQPSLEFLKDKEEGKLLSNLQRELFDQKSKYCP